MTFEAFIKKHKNAIYKFANSYRIENYTVDDLYQELCLEAWIAYQTFDPDGGSTLFTWFYTHARNRMNLLFENQKAFKRTHHFNIDSLDRDLDTINTFKEPYDIIDEQNTQDKQQLIWDYIDTQPYGYRARWHYIANMTQRRIAEIEGISNQAVNQWFKALHEKLREQFPDIQTYI
jgi:RNA polymerase sigma factor (sigma-70 family)